jgi:glycosyltransferase involved in cell wall biosynthesis
MAARSDKRHVVISNGVDLAVYGDDGASMRGSEWDVTYIGRLIDEKRVDLLLEALAQLRDRRPAVRCVIVGEGPARATLEARAAALGLAERVRFLGRVDQSRAIDILRDTRTLVMPSAREGFGMAVIEAMACGAVPIVVRGRYSAAADLVRDQVDGRICDASSDAIAASIDELLGSPDTLAGMRREARSTAASFDWDAIALKMERAYQMGARVSPVSANAT